ncbi:uncharacterized protein LOC21394747 isoform X2 [Morus notabilis]|uniref:uncharacterized protein LOC21394747 isoform X2 n=1 Tax=Morus notabilis TaxID=981085 RepID=UPI000CED109A|nr:uncharacterized protein LOC21394747 isoform X2 [Morus notabilis]
MATLPSILSSSSSSSLLPLHRPSLPRSRSSLCFFPLRSSSPASRKFQTLVRASSAPSFGDLSSNFRSSRFESSKKSALSNLIHEIEPLDVSLIQKDVPPATVDAMKRTISGMLGLLPSDQFQVLIEALWEPLSKLLVSSMMTGYTLRNAEYRLCLKKNFDACEENLEKERMESSKFDVQGMLRESASTIKPSAKDELSSKSGKICVDPSKNNEKQGLGDMSPEAQEYIQQLRSQLSSVKKVAELSEPTSPELKEMIHSVVHGLLATLSPRMHSKVPPLSENTTTGTVSAEGGDCAEIVENTSLQFQPLILLTRDYLARLLFWCMLLGHYLRGLEYRMELMELLSLRSDSEGDTDYGKQAA